MIVRFISAELLELIELLISFDLGYDLIVVSVETAVENGSGWAVVSIEAVAMATPPRAQPLIGPPYQPGWMQLFMSGR